MATSAITILIANPYATGGTGDDAAGGTWTANTTYSLLIVANYNKSGYDHDGMGWAAASVCDGVTAAGGNQTLVIPLTAADPIPYTYSLYYQSNAAHFDLGAVCTHAGDFAGSLTTLTSTGPDDAHTTTFGTTHTSFDLDPVVLVPGPRKNIARSYDGSLGQLSYRTARMHDTLTVNTTASATPCSVANWRILQKIARGNIRVLITDGDTDADVLTWTCMLDPSGFVNTAFKGNGAISLPFIVESETYHA